MTGYGKGTAEAEKRYLTIEMKSVNSRFLEINCRMPKIFAFCEDGLRKLIGGTLKRGAVDVYFSYEDKSEGASPLSADMNLAAAYAGIGKELAKTLKIKNGVDAAFILRQEGTLYRAPKQDDGEALQGLMLEAAGRALEALDAMRANEGAALYKELVSLGGALSAITEDISKLSKAAADEYREKVRARMSEILKDISLDESRILAEAAFLADRADITEELARLDSHLKQYAQLLEKQEAGKKLDFLTQELNREANTIGSKVADIRITELVMQAKAVIEKIKEQVRNIE